MDQRQRDYFAHLDTVRRRENTHIAVFIILVLVVVAVIAGTNQEGPSGVEEYLMDEYGGAPTYISPGPDYP